MLEAVAIICLLLLVSISAAARDDCECGSAEAFNSFANTLTGEPSCSVAADKLQKCAWESSADAQPASIVIGKCEKTFLLKPAPAGTERCQDEMYLWAYE